MDLNVKDNYGSAFKLVALYAPSGAGQPEFFRRLEAFLGTSRSLELIGDWNAILVVRVDWVVVADRKMEYGNLSNLLGFSSWQIGSDWISRKLQWEHGQIVSGHSDLI